MKNLKKKILSIILTSTLIASSGIGAIVPAFANEATSSSTTEINWKDPNNWYEKWMAEKAAREAAAAAAASNTNTGADSTNTSTSDTTNNTEADINNDADIVNVASGEADTGSNDSDRNTGDGSVTSGTASLSADLSTDANKVSVNGLEGDACLQIGCLGGGGSAENSTTGSDSTNDASSSTENNTDIYVDNDLDVQNIALLTADSGDNSASRNTGDGTVVSGDADLTLTALNVGNNVNVGVQTFNIMDDQTGDLVLNFDDLEYLQTASGSAGASNDTTGAGSTNNATTTNSNNNLIVINNDGTIANDYVLTADTGNNDANRNTGDGSVTTGDANVAVNVINFLNNTFLGGAGELLLGVVNIFGSLDGNIVINPPPGGSAPVLSPEALAAANLKTGADSANLADSSNSNDLSINTNNTADVLNGITLNANTGGNDASKNTGGGSVETGDVNANLKATTIANTTTVGNNGDLWLVLVNNMGTWTGQLMGLNTNGVASPFFSFVVGPDGTLMAVNNQTGADSTNTANASNSNTTDINVNNNGSVDNNIVINANTGNNNASMNTGSGTIKTGDVNVAANLINILNNTFIGSRMIITLVNVFGSFNGNVLPPGTANTGSPKANEIVTNSSGGQSNNPSGSLAAPLGSLTTGGSSAVSDSEAKESKKNSLVLAASDNFGAPNVTKVVTESGSNNNLRNIIFMMIITAASVQLALKLGRRRWLLRKS